MSDRANLTLYQLRAMIAGWGPEILPPPLDDGDDEIFADVSSLFDRTQDDDLAPASQGAQDAPVSLAQEPASRD